MNEKLNYFWLSIIGNSRAVLEVGLTRKANCWTRRWKDSLMKLAKNSIGCIKQEGRFLASGMLDNSLIDRSLDPVDDGKLSHAGINGLPEIDHKIITIVFWDIQGFSALCYSLEITPALLILFLKEFFEAATKAILEQGGVVDKFLCDGLWLFSGLIQILTLKLKIQLSALLALH